MSRYLSGVRGRVTLTVLAVSACLYSLLGAVGFLQIADSGRDAIRERIDTVLDQLDAGLRAGAATTRIATPDGVEASARTARDPAEPADDSELRTERTVNVGGSEIRLVGRASQVRLTESLRSLHRGLWVAVPLAAIVTALMAGLATQRALRPVARMTALVDTIGADDDTTRVPPTDTDDEIEQLSATLNRMLDRIALGRNAQRQFTSDAAHELRTPLMAIRGELEIARRHPDTVDDGFLGRVDAQAERLADRVDDLVLLSTLDEAPPLNLRPERLMAIVRHEAAAAPFDVRLSGDDAATAPMDRRLMERAVSNLLANAIRHARSTVRAEVTADPARLHLRVEDDGPGIEPAHRERVFQRFGRLDEARGADGGGAGLGLAIVASVARLHGGGVSVDDGRLGGACVHLWVPVER